MAIGGIGTYAFEATRMLALDGYEIEVFAAGKRGEEPASEYGVIVHRLDVTTRKEFKKAVIPIFAERNRQRPFNVLESPEYGAEGAGIKAAFPHIPLVVKLHTPTYLTARVSCNKATLLQKIRFLLGALRRGRWKSLQPGKYNFQQDDERKFTASAEEVAAPSQAIGKIVGNEWKLDGNKIHSFPYPYQPDAKLLNLPLPKSSKTLGFTKGSPIAP